MAQFFRTWYQHSQNPQSWYQVPKWPRKTRVISNIQPNPLTYRITLKKQDNGLRFWSSNHQISFLIPLEVVIEIFCSRHHPPLMIISSFLCFDTIFLSSEGVRPCCDTLESSIDLCHKIFWQKDSWKNKLRGFKPDGPRANFSLRWNSKSCAHAH